MITVFPTIHADPSAATPRETKKNIDRVNTLVVLAYANTYPTRLLAAPYAALAADAGLTLLMQSPEYWSG